MMAHGRLYVIYLLIVHFLCVLAFRVSSYSRGRFPAPTQTNTNRLNTPITALLSVTSSDDGEGARSSSPRRPKTSRKGRRRRQRYTFIDESHTTAAGVESLFSLRWWPSSYERATTKSYVVHDELYLNSLDDLPLIDCSWACVSNTEKIQLQQMKLLLQSELKMITDINLHEQYPDIYSDLRLLRFLRKSRDRDVNSAAERYRSFLHWREKSKVDDIRDMIEDCGGSFTPTSLRLQVVASHFPMNFDYLAQESDEFNNLGDKPVVKPAILNVGEFDTRGITEKILAPDSDVVLEDFLNYWIFLYESIHLMLFQQSIQFGQMVYLDEVCDLSGLSLRQFSPSFVSKVMSPWLKMTQAYYPETTRRIFILHPPAIIKVAWKLVTPLLSQGTIDKIRFVRRFDGSADEFVESVSWID